MKAVMYGHGLVDKEGKCHAPTCCGQSMDDDGRCAAGCCDDFRCGKCGRRLRIEWPD